MKGVKKPRKPRGLKQTISPITGRRVRSYDLCPVCYSYDCNPMTDSKKFRDKIDKRKAKGECPSCGNKKCKCKSSLSIRRGG